MWRLIAVSVAALWLFASAGCKSAKPPAASETTPSEPPLASTIAVGDAQHASQILRGFYAVEASWRWTQKSFAVQLAAPNGAAQRGARLELRFTIPDPIIQNLKSISLSASVNGLELKPERYEKAGQYIYARDIPAGQLQSSAVPVEFTLDRALPPGPVDKRELGIVATEVGLTPN